jgi:hypothetical protein
MTCKPSLSTPHIDDLNHATTTLTLPYIAPSIDTRAALKKAVSATQLRNIAITGRSRTICHRWTSRLPTLRNCESFDVARRRLGDCEFIKKNQRQLVMCLCSRDSACIVGTSRKLNNRNTLAMFSSLLV